MLVILGNQLFPLHFLPPPGSTRIFMAEDYGLCTYERHHQQKIVLFLAAMRAYADELRFAGYDVHYVYLDVHDRRPFEAKLADAMRINDEEQLLHFEIEDKPLETRIVEYAETSQIDREEIRSPMFSCTRAGFADFVGKKDRLRMSEFYKQQRRQLGILLDDSGEPVGGRWSFDTENRKKLPRDVNPPEVVWPEPEDHVADVIALVKREFPEHPGNADEFRWPTTRYQALDWLDEFAKQRLTDFGPYEDAMSARSDTVFHSLLSPYLNMGLLTPDEVLARVLAVNPDAPLQSVEGFVRQVIGWREFVRGVYRHFSERQEEENFWSHHRELGPAWYDGSTGIPPLDDAIHAAQRLGWAHHIQRLMVLGSLMTLCEIQPSSAHRWFMEMFVDSSEWVMGPNVYGMGLFSDGGVFATKPYICGSNYLLKMSDYRKGPWCDIVDGLYWRFIARHRDFFATNPRLALMPRALDRLDENRKRHIFSAAEQFLQDHTHQDGVDTGGQRYA